MFTVYRQQPPRHRAQEPPAARLTSVVLEGQLERVLQQGLQDAVGGGQLSGHFLHVFLTSSADYKSRKLTGVTTKDSGERERERERIGGAPWW